jgi:hypothetical protein
MEEEGYIKRCKTTAMDHVTAIPKVSTKTNFPNDGIGARRKSNRATEWGQ